MRRILIVDDDKVTQKLIEYVLNSDFLIYTVSNLKEAYALIKVESIDLIILDRNLSDGDGIEFCRQLRLDEKYSEVPILILSSLSSEADKIIGFYSGADDYICKPFSPLELKARVQARLRNLKNIIYTNELEINLDSRVVKYKKEISKEAIDLTPIEFKLLIFFLKNKNSLFNREHLIEKIWGNQTSVNDRVIDTHLSHLRKKLLKTTLQFLSYRGEGYKLVA
jgi:two-component system alkaline phosphatase synthesis response regulator PhoP